LDQAYAKFRDRAALEWAVRISDAKDPADACVNVRIAIPVRLPHRASTGPTHLRNPAPAVEARSAKVTH